MRALVVVACLAMAHGAAAETAPADRKAARDHFKAGAALVKAERFDEAIRELETAYDLDPQAEHLYNLGVAHHLRGDEGAALQYYRLYLLEGASGKEARNAASYVTALEKRVAEQRAEATRKELVEVQAKSTSSANTTEQIIYAQYMADAENKESRIVLVKRQIEATKAETAELTTRDKELREVASNAAFEARRWEHYARRAPAGEGTTRRIVGMTLLALGGAAITIGAHDELAGGADVGVPTFVPAYIGGGAVAAVCGLVVLISGELAATAPRKNEVFKSVQVMPTVGASGGGVALGATF